MYTVMRTARSSVGARRRAHRPEVLKAAARLIGGVLPDELPRRRVQRDLTRAEQQAADRAPRGCRGRWRAAPRRR